MYDTIPMQVAHSSTDFLDEMAGYFLGKIPVLLQLLE
jgi:hypothetical protein